MSARKLGKELGERGSVRTWPCTPPRSAGRLKCLPRTPVGELWPIANYRWHRPTLHGAPADDSLHTHRLKRWSACTPSVSFSQGILTETHLESPITVVEDELVVLVDEESSSSLDEPVTPYPTTVVGAGAGALAKKAPYTDEHTRSENPCKDNGMRTHGGCICRRRARSKKSKRYSTERLHLLEKVR